MDFRIADTFTDALARLPVNDQKAVKLSVMDLQLDPSAPGLQMHRIDKSKDPNFWSARVNRDIRLILHRTVGSLLVAYVNHHDAAYAWAERRRIEAHPRTGAVQIVQVREVVEAQEPDVARRWRMEYAQPGLAEAPPAAFGALTREQLLEVGVPADWIDPVLEVSEEGFLDIAACLPAEASEALLQFATTGQLRPSAPAANDPAPSAPIASVPPYRMRQRTSDAAPMFLSVFGAPRPSGTKISPSAFEHPDARRRFARIDSSEELEAALDAPWDTWSVFLHPSQREVVERSYNGPARVAGSAGTGKTVVALHRTVRHIKQDPNARILLTTFSEPLAGSLRAKLAVLAGPDSSIVPRVTVASFQSLADELFQLAFGRRPRVGTAEQVEAALASAAKAAGLKGFSQRFLAAEWANVVDAWRVSDAEAYAAVPRLGRRNRLGARQREALWPVFAAAGDLLRSQGVLTWPGVFHQLADYYGATAQKPFSHVIVDEAQDLGVPELRLLCTLAPDGEDRLFFAGDLGQRIFQQPFSWKALGADVRGRSTTLKVNYRTSQQIREAADRLLPGLVRDVDGREEDRKGTISVFEGPAPQVLLLEHEADEAEAVARFIRDAQENGIGPGEIGVFVRSRKELPRARAAVTAAGQEPAELSERTVDVGSRVAIGTMHLAKGLEFKAVAVMACDDEVLPSGERIDAVVDESDLDEVYETERHLLYVACTRARDRLLVSGVKPGSEFLADIKDR